MPAIERIQVAANQRVIKDDWNDTNLLGQTREFNIVKNFFAPAGGWLQPGNLTHTGGMNALLEGPVAAVMGSLLAIEEADSAIVFNAGDSSNPRIDLLSVRAVEADASSKMRNFRDPNTGAISSQPTPTRKAVTVTIELTQGTPAASPSPPAVPVGDVALWHVLVPAGASALDPANFTLVQSASARPVQVQGAEWSGAGIQALPWTSATLLSVTTPKRQITTIEIDVFLIQVGSFAPTTWYGPLRIEIEDVASGAIVGRAEEYFFQGESKTVRVKAVVVGPSSGERSYRLRLSDAAGAGSTLGSMNIATKYSDLATTVVNRATAITG